MKVDKSFTWHRVDPQALHLKGLKVASAWPMLIFLWVPRPSLLRIYALRATRIEVGASHSDQFFAQDVDLLFWGKLART